MAERKTLRPAVPGSLVRKESRIPLAQEGEEVTMTLFWERRLAEGDVVEVKAGVPVQAVAPAAAEESPVPNVTKKGGSNVDPKQ